MAKAIMIQGTMSNAGKSFVVAGLGRVFRQDGWRVAPFKSQNMALNSYITAEGLEMGRAQVMQAQACGLEPSVRMNPILLKPTTDVGSQVIVNGRPRGNMRAIDYFRYKKQLIPEIMEAYHSLEQENDIMIIEGAGSPAEINLKQEDIVNMGMAKLAGAPVLLVGDIDRGGVFAQLMGTVILLEEEERRRIQGFLMNKFRGDVRILQPGLDMLYERCGISTLGVIPYAHLDLEDEDSLSERLSEHRESGLINLAVIRLPHLSNFTDFNPLEAASGVTVHYTEKPEELAGADLILLPGTKSTMADLRWLRMSGLEAAVCQCAARGVPVLGICGGYQMLGEELWDPEGAEGECGDRLRGMGLLPIRTVFSLEKRTTQMHGQTLRLPEEWKELEAVFVSGYEIHMGSTEILQGTPFAELSSTRRQESRRGDANWETEDVILDGCVRANVLGTYLHGIFEEEAFSRALLRLLCRRRGLDPSQLKAVSYEEHREQEYDKLAELIRQNVDMKQVYRILEEWRE